MAGSAQWYGEDDDTLSVVAKTRRNLEGGCDAVSAMSCVILTCTGVHSGRPWQVLAVYGPVHARLLRSGTELIADCEVGQEKSSPPGKFAF